VYDHDMTLKGRIQNGQVIVLDKAPPGYPEGAELELLIVDPHLDMTDEEREELERDLEEGERDFEEGRYVPASEVLEELRRRRG
jgi:hypothetical protein